MNSFLKNILNKKIKKMEKPFGFNHPNFLKEFIINIDEIQKEWKSYISFDTNCGLPIDDISEAQKGMNKDKKWKAVILYAHSYFNNGIEKQFPKTMKLIKNHTNSITVALFSTIEPGMHIKPHKGNFNGVLRIQIGISIKDDGKSFIRVENEKCYLKEKEFFIFDDTFTHEAKNESDKNRTVLILDFFKPLPFPYNLINKRDLKTLRKTDYVQKVIKKF